MTSFAKRWDTQTGELLTTYGGFGTENPRTDSLYGIAYSPDSKYVLTGGWDGVMRLYDAQSGKELHEFSANKESIYGVAFSPDGRLALSGGKDKTAHLWDVQTGQELTAPDRSYSEIYILSPSRRMASSHSPAARTTRRASGISKLVRNYVVSPVIQALWSGQYSPLMGKPSSQAAMMAPRGCGMWITTTR